MLRRPVSLMVRWSLTAREGTIDLQPARRAAQDLRWRETYTLLRQADQSSLGPDDLALFADAAWWCCSVAEELALRQQAFAGFVAAGRPRRAAYSAWLLSVRYGLRGEPTTASGWLQRAQRQLVGEPDCLEQGYVACSEAEQALGAGRLDEAGEHARRAVAVGQRFGAAELVALAISWQGLCLLARKEVAEGLQLLDEAMTSVAAGELDAHFTGWVSCFAVGMCMGVADLRRAGGWAQAAWDWAASLPQATPYLGLCRVRQVEVMSLRGELEAAAVEGQRACEELLAFEPHLAGEAFVVTGEILRRRGETAAAERAFAEARELGHDPQPGLARIRLGQGRTRAAASSLRAAVANPGLPPYRRASLLAAQVEVALAEEQLATAREACAGLDAMAGEVASEALVAVAETARGRLLLAEGDPAGALGTLRSAATTWQALEMACEMAETRLLVGLAMRALGDEEGAELELASARRSFQHLGAWGDAERLDAAAASGQPWLPAGLTNRECEVLRLVASGHTNRQVATELVLSPHTVARHLSNIYIKLGVSSRTAAAAFAFDHDLGRPPAGPGR